MSEILSGIALFSACSLTYVAVAFPSGRIIEEHTNEVWAKRCWHFVLAACAIFIFMSFSGVGEVVYHYVRISNETAGMPTPVSP